MQKYLVFTLALVFGLLACSACQAGGFLSINFGQNFRQSRIERQIAYQQALEAKQRRRLAALRAAQAQAAYEDRLRAQVSYEAELRAARLQAEQDYLDRLRLQDGYRQQRQVGRLRIHDRPLRLNDGCSAFFTH